MIVLKVMGLLGLAVLGALLIVVAMFWMMDVADNIAIWRDNRRDKAEHN